MLFNILIGILAFIGGLVVLAILVVIIAYVLLARHATLKIRGRMAEMQVLLEDSMEADGYEAHSLSSIEGGVPPMRIRLEPIPTDVFDDEPTVERIDRWLRKHRFRHVDDFCVEEFEDEYLRVYIADDHLMLAAIRSTADSTEPYVEFCFDLAGGLRGGVSNPPGSPIPLPPDAVGKYLQGELSGDFQLLSRMWLQAKELVDENPVQAIDPERIAEFFEEAHATEMNYRIARGGVTEDEIRASFAAQGIAPTKSDIEEIQEQWQDAIEEHLLDYSTRGQNQSELGREILVVHDGSPRSYLINRIANLLEDMDDFDHEQLPTMLRELKHLLKRFSQREAIARFRPLLPAPVRYDLVDQLKQPVEADLYAMPYS